VTSLIPFSESDRRNFLNISGWDNASMSNIGSDWSQRQFIRVEKNQKTAVIMQSFPDAHAQSIVGHKVLDFITISKYLIHIGLSAPRIYAQDLDKGLLLVEDFGIHDFVSLIVQSDVKSRDAYILATKTLKHIYLKTEYIEIDLPDFNKSHIQKGHQRVVDWYMPAVLGQKNSDILLDDYLAVWKKIEKSLPRINRRLLHGDFHPGNLMWLPERQGIEQTGLIDFQQAMMGPSPYDLVNLLDDARREVPEVTRKECLNLFTEGMRLEDKENFLIWYRVLATQFHCRVIGQAIRLAIKDKKIRLLSIIPILRRHIIKDLSHPVLNPLSEWFLKQGVDFMDTEGFEIEKIAPFIRDDAY